jgi:hypothetical protein
MGITKCLRINWRGEFVKGDAVNVLLSDRMILNTSKNLEKNHRDTIRIFDCV